MDSENAAVRGGNRVRAPHHGAAIIVALAIVAAGNAVPYATKAAGIDPLPAVAKAIGSVKSYEVMTTSSSTGSFPRRRVTPVPGTRRGTRRGLGFGGFGPQTRTIVAVRKGSLFEDYVVIKGKDRAGKSTTSNAIIYGNKLCTRASASAAYSCNTGTSQYALDPTAAFAAGAGSTVFTATQGRTINGQRCDGYSYTNKSQYSTATGVVYIAHTTKLPCEQDSVVIRHAPGGGPGFTQRSKSVWSHFNDTSLSVPAVP